MPHWRTLNSPILARRCRARIGCLWRSEGIAGVLPGSASPRRSRPARDTRARASELQQAPRPPAATAVPAHKVTVHDRQRGVVHEFVVPEVRPASPRARCAPLSLFPGEGRSGMDTDMGSWWVAGAGPVHSAHRGGAGHQAAVRVPAR
jgi:hypothetical protein